MQSFSHFVPDFLPDFRVAYNYEKFLELTSFERKGTLLVAVCQSLKHWFPTFCSSNEFSQNFCFFLLVFGGLIFLKPKNIFSSFLQLHFSQINCKPRNIDNNNNNDDTNMYDVGIIWLARNEDLNKPQFCSDNIGRFQLYRVSNYKTPFYSSEECLKDNFNGKQKRSIVHAGCCTTTKLFVLFASWDSGWVSEWWGRHLLPPHQTRGSRVLASVSRHKEKYFVPFLKLTKSQPFFSYRAAKLGNDSLWLVSF